MNVASLELCKELYELSGWDDTDEWLHQKGNGDTKLFLPINIHLMDCDAPAYELGYLIRRIPKANVTAYLDATVWNASSFADEAENVPNQEAGTPEDAAAKLAIELFKQGALERQS